MCSPYVYEHVELGYATTGYGAQGDTTTEAHLVLTDTTTAAAAYVAMTRGREANTAHLVAADLDDAREQWVAAFGRDRADLGPTAASEAAARAAAGYTALRPLSEIAAELRAAWDDRADAESVLRHYRPLLEQALAARPRVVAEQAAEQHAWAQHNNARRELAATRDRLADLEHAIDSDADRIAEELRAAWDAQRLAAQADARRIEAGVGRFGRGRAEVAAATGRLEAWAAHWQPVVGDLHRQWRGLVGYATARPGNDHIDHPLGEHARTQAARRPPGRARGTGRSRGARRTTFRLRIPTLAGAQPAPRRASQAGRSPGHPEAVARMTELVDASQHQFEQADQRLTSLRREPAVADRPDPDSWLARQHASWRRDRDEQRRADELARPAEQHAQRAAFSAHQHWQPAPQIDHGPSFGR